MRKFVPFLSACLLGACVSGPAWPDGASKVDRKAMAAEWSRLHANTEKTAIGGN